MSASIRGGRFDLLFRWKALLPIAALLFATGAVLPGCSDSLEKAQVSGVNTEVLAIINPEVCNGCGKCYPVCPPGAIDSVITPNPASPVFPLIDFLINTDNCTRCGVCFKVCPVAAIGWKR